MEKRENEFIHRIQAEITRYYIFYNNSPSIVVVSPGLYILIKNYIHSFFQQIDPEYSYIKVNKIETIFGLRIIKSYELKNEEFEVR